MKGFQRFTTSHPASSVTQLAGSRTALFERVVLLFLALSLILAGCTGAATVPTSTPKPAATIETTPAPTPTLTPKVLPKIETTLTAAERAAIFEASWQTVNEGFFDPTFGGKDWQAIGEKYRQKLASVQDDHTFWLQLLNPVLFELGVSHIGALPAELSTQLSPETFTTGSVGVDVRLLDGWIVEAINSVNLQTPPDNERHRRGNAVSGLRSALYGEVGAEVIIEYLDANDQPRRATLQFAPRRSLSCSQFDPAMPPACVGLLRVHVLYFVATQ
jgi:hypothetical protein